MPAGFSGSASIASGRRDQGIKYAVDAPKPITIMSIRSKRILMFSGLPIVNKFWIEEYVESDGKNIANKQVDIQIEPPK